MDFEIDIIKWLQKGRTTFGDIFFSSYAYFASIFAVAVIALVIFFLFDKKSGIAFIVTSGFAAGLAWLLKKIIARPRPFEEIVGIANVGRETGYSMPSGHSVAAMIIFVFAVYIAFKYYKKVGRILITFFSFVFLILMAIDRMYLGVHYITDILAGWGIGLAFCAFSAVFFPRFFAWTDKIWARHLEKKSTNNNNTSDSNKED